ncbi:MAG: tyrosine-type recombinase/integrase [Solibacillus sp.]
MSDDRVIKRRRSRVDERSTPVNSVQNIGVTDAWSYFITAKVGEGIRKRTQEDYSSTWRYFTEWLNEVDYKVKYVSEITPSMCREYIRYLTEDAPRYKNHKYMQAGKFGKGLSSATINMRIRALKVAFNFWKADNMIRTSPMDNVRCQKDDVDKIESFTDEQIQAMLNACDQRTYVGFRDYVFQICLLDTGMRMNELLSITLESVDLKSRSIHLGAEFNKNRRYRIVPISPETLKLLLEIVDENKQHFPHAKRIFLSCYGEEVRDTQMNKRLKYYGDMTGVGKEIRSTAHTWRHTFARNFILNGGDPYTLMRILGHSSIHMTRRYVQMTDGDMQVKHLQHSPLRNIKKKLR